MTDTALLAVRASNAAAPAQEVKPPEFAYGPFWPEFEAMTQFNDAGAPVPTTEQGRLCTEVRRSAETCMEKPQ